MNGKYTYRCLRQEWCVATENANPNYGTWSIGTIFSVWPTREEAEADIKSHGEPDKYSKDTWVPFGSYSGYERLAVVYREVPVDISEVCND